MAIIWLLCILASLKDRGHYAIKCSLLGITILYALLVTGANIFQYFVVYGRLVKAVVPMLCLISAYELSRLDNRILWPLLLAVVFSYLLNSYQLHKAILYGDVSRAYRDQVERLSSDKHRLSLQTTCKPYLPQCGAPVDADCMVVDSFLSHVNLRFFQYEAVSPESRALANTHKFYYQIIDCPKK